MLEALHLAQDKFLGLIHLTGGEVILAIGGLITLILASTRKSKGGGLIVFLVVGVIVFLVAKDAGVFNHTHH